MRTLLHKYLNNAIAPGELVTLRKEIESLSDSDIEREMLSDWIGSGRVSGAAVTAPSVWLRILRWAAVIMLPVLVLVSIYLYNDNRHLASQDIIIATSGGDRASVQLPDGSTVTLNSNSRLSYSAAGFASSERKVDFDGEGFFTVAKDAKHPFVVSNEQLTVTVRGTAFNLLARHDMDEAELYLENGAVELCAVKTGERIGITPGQLAVLDYHTGRITVSSDPATDIRMAWRSGDLVYINKPLKDVLHSLERNYNYSIRLNSDTTMDDVLFTGTLSSTNIYDAVRILELTFDLRCSGADSVLVLSNIR